MRAILEEQYEEYLHPERAKLLKKNRKTLDQLDNLQAKLNHHTSLSEGADPLSEEETRLRDMVLINGTHHSDHHLYQSEVLSRKEMCDASCQTLISGDIRPV